MNSSVVSVNGITKRFGRTFAIDDIHFDIPKGRIVGMIGPNGSGKTTTLKAILGLTSFSGEMNVLGLDPRTQRDELMQDVCFIADVAILPRWIRVRDLVDFVAGVHHKFDRKKAERYLEKTKLQPNMKVKALSKGMVVQLHLALIMAIKTKLLILDEPTLGLDILYRKQFYQALMEDYFDDEMSIIITTHQVEEIENVLSDAMFIREGKVILYESMESIAERFTEVIVKPGCDDAANILKPINQRSIFGKKAMLFDGVSKEDLADLGELHTPSLSDLFVATMKGAMQ